MKILVNGPSVSLGHIAWTHHLETKTGFEIANFSRVGCGNKYIHDATIAAIAQCKYDLVIISWTYYHRSDCRFRSISELRGPEIEDKHIVNNKNIDKHWFFTGIANESKGDNHNYASYMTAYNWFFSNEAKIEETLLYMISLQSILKQLNIPYIFTFYRPLIRLKKFQHLYDLIDYNNIHNVHLYHLAKHNNWILNDHPDAPAHVAYAETLLEHPNIKNLIKL